MNYKPNIAFIGIGEPKAGTTWLYSILNDHPDICCSSIKETNFFSSNYDRGWGWYSSLFDNNQKGIKGEFSFYFRDIKALERVKKHYPYSKHILILRNPVDRHISAYNYSFNKGTIKKDINEYFSDIKRKGSLIYHHLDNYLKYFKKEQLLVIIFQDIKERPSEVARDVYEFLEADPNYHPASLKTVVNAGSKMNFKHKGLNAAMYFIRRKVYESEFKLFLLKLIGVLRINKLGKMIHEYNRSKGKSEKKLPKQEFVDSFKRYIADDIKEMESYLNRDLSHWYN